MGFADKLLVSDIWAWLIAISLGVSILTLIVATLWKAYDRVRYPKLAECNVLLNLPATGQVKVLLPPSAQINSVLFQFRPASGYANGSFVVTSGKEEIARLELPKKRTFLPVTYQRSLLFTPKSMELRVDKAVSETFLLLEYILESNVADPELKDAIGRKFRIGCAIFGTAERVFKFSHQTDRPLS